ncbi:hypothetical protein POTOM_049451 [Populus tomentosa]|uniref:Homeobox protein knotted-1-like 2 n=1 Tax=Populus tomentosa TaxID=118781 RepID=A0A8X7Y6D2_POPTO|nr:hypothetical protein POTOM_049451 [Populus tomentosa]
MMEQLHGLQSTSTDYSLQVPSENAGAPVVANYYHHMGFPSAAGEASFPFFGSEQLFCGSSVSDAASMVVELHQQQQRAGCIGDNSNSNNSQEEASCAIRAKIASHPLYPKLLEAYIDCQKVGAPPEMAYLLDEIREENDVSKRSDNIVASCLGADPELDEFMETYCHILMKYKADLSGPFDEATAFLNDIEAQFKTLCNGASRSQVHGLNLYLSLSLLLLKQPDHMRNSGSGCCHGQFPILVLDKNPAPLRTFIHILAVKTKISCLLYGKRSREAPAARVRMFLLSSIVIHSFLLMYQITVDLLLLRLNGLDMEGHKRDLVGRSCKPRWTPAWSAAKSDEAAGSCDEDASGGEAEAEVQDCTRANDERELKDKLLCKYSGYISTLKHEFSKKKKKGKLPKEAREVLLNWWTVHYKWPYPTEADKVALAESTGLEQKQINNWFINQRKRHWKPSENMQFAVVDSLYGPFFMNG